MNTTSGINHAATPFSRQFATSATTGVSRVGSVDTFGGVSAGL